MAIQTICSGCGKTLAVSDEHSGKKARCPACGQIYTVPLSNDPLGDSAAPPAADESPQNDPLAETTAGLNSDRAEHAAADPRIPSEQYWMRTSDGSEYGPVDRANLNRWFHEGRVGPGYQIRVGETGLWQPAELFNLQTQVRAPQAVSSPGSSGMEYGGSGNVGSENSGGNPYAENAYQPTYPTSIGRFQKGDPSGLVLTMGILSWVLMLICPFVHWIPGLVAWISGSSALKDIRAGIADPTNTALVQVGYYLGMINVILTLLFLAGLVAFGALSAIAQNM